ncbi:MAG: sigma 54-interacting transcriptional regulator [Candidatus Latescibacterota bacterium]
MTTAARQITFEYKAMSFRTRAVDMLYRCPLRGHEETWQPARRERFALYRDLPPGEYTFEVCAVDRDLNESEPAQVRLQVVLDERDRRIDELTSLAQALSGAGSGEFVGHSPALGRALDELRQVAPTDATVLILGETGTGKGLAARAVHTLSGRREGPFVTVSCGSLPPGLVESELFGHERGAFTGALRRKLGKVELARGGTLFLDEIGDLPLEAQAKLLRLLEERTFERVGGTEELTCGARVVAATNRNLQRMVAARSFRADLYYRLHVVPVSLPPLRQRREDVGLLATYFARRVAQHLGKRLHGLEPAALAALETHDWPGNVRELEHVVRCAVILCRADRIRAQDLPLGVEPSGTEAGSGRPTPEEYEREYLREALERSGWVVGGLGGAAARLGMPESSLRFRMGRLGIRRP